MTGRRAHLLATASRPGAREATWQRATTDESLTNDQLRALVQGFSRPADPRAPAYAERYFASIVGWWAGRTMTMATILARGLFPGGSLDPGGGPSSTRWSGRPAPGCMSTRTPRARCGAS